MNKGLYSQIPFLWKRLYKLLSSAVSFKTKNFFLAVAANASFSLAKFELQTLFTGGKSSPAPGICSFPLLQLSACKKMPFLQFLPVASVPIK